MMLSKETSNGNEILSLKYLSSKILFVDSSEFYEAE
jgi:hypothetical protein